MQTRTKMLLRTWIEFLIVVGCGALITWMIMCKLASIQFDYLAFLEKIHSDAHLHSILNMEEKHLFLVSILLWAIIMGISVLLFNMPICCATQIELGYLLVIFPLNAIFFVFIGISGYEIPFFYVSMFWLGITDAIWLSIKFVRWIRWRAAWFAWNHKAKLSKS